MQMTEMRYSLIETHLNMAAVLVLSECQTAEHMKKTADLMRTQVVHVVQNSLQDKIMRHKVLVEEITLMYSPTYKGLQSYFHARSLLLLKNEC